MGLGLHWGSARGLRPPGPGAARAGRPWTAGYLCEAQGTAGSTRGSARGRSGPPPPSAPARGSACVQEAAGPGRRGHSGKKRAALRRRSDRVPRARPRPSPAPEHALRGRPRWPAPPGSAAYVPPNSARSDRRNLEPRGPPGPGTHLAPRRRKPDQLLPPGLEAGPPGGAGRGPGGRRILGPGRAGPNRSASPGSFPEARGAIVPN